MGLFGVKRRRLATNAPRHWPEVAVELWSEENDAVNCLAVSKELASAGELSLRFYDRLLYDDGVLQIPLVVSEGGRRTAVFIYSRADSEAAAHFSGARSLLRARESLNAVYYAPEAIQPARPAPVLQALDTQHFSAPESEPPDAEYALWWSTPEDPSLADSPALPQLDRWFNALAGYTPFAFSAFLDALDLLGEENDEGEQDKPRLLAPPDTPLMVPVVAPGELSLYLHASQGESVWLAADTGRTPAARRNTLLKQLADLAEELRHAVEGQKVPPVEDAERVLGFWRNVRADALQKERQPGAELQLLTITHGTRLPGATTAAERARTASEQPDDQAVQFAAQQLDFAMAVVKQAESARAQESGVPGLQMFLASRVGGGVFRTVLPFSTPPDVEAILPDLLAERPDADLAALVYDAYVRSGDSRRDAIFVRTERRGAGKSQVLVQPYQSGPIRPAGNWFLMSDEAAMFPALELPPPVAPSAALRALLDECVRQTLEWVRIGNPSGSEFYAEDQPLSSPVLYAPIDGRTVMNRFALGGHGWAMAAASKVLSEHPGTTLAVLLYDDVTTLNGAHARSLRFRAHERGMPHALEYALAYDMPVKGKPFATRGELQLLRAAQPLFR